MTKFYYLKCLFFLFHFIPSKHSRAATKAFFLFFFSSKIRCINFKNLRTEYDIERELQKMIN